MRLAWCGRSARRRVMLRTTVFMGLARGAVPPTNDHETVEMSRTRPEFYDAGYTAWTNQTYGRAHAIHDADSSLMNQVRADATTVDRRQEARGLPPGVQDQVGARQWSTDMLTSTAAGQLHTQHFTAQQDAGASSVVMDDLTMELDRYLANDQHPGKSSMMDVGVADRTSFVMDQTEGRANVDPWFGRRELILTGQTPEIQDRYLTDSGQNPTGADGTINPWYDIRELVQPPEVQGQIGTEQLSTDVFTSAATGQLDALNQQDAGESRVIDDLTMV
ncbi:hypothetical protein GNI_047470, partial [Gregarina niphandrodes]